MGNILQINKDELLNLIRDESIRGFENISDEEIFTHLAEIFPEFEFIKYLDATKNLIDVGVKEEHAQFENEIMRDIARVVQIKF